jgi:hypothetical protein
MTFAFTLGFGPAALGNYSRQRTFDPFHYAEGKGHVWGMWLGPLGMMVQAKRARP